MPTTNRHSHDQRSRHSALTLPSMALVPLALMAVGGGMPAHGKGAAAAGTKDQRQKPNILFILCDDMGYGDLACYGQPYIQTPNIDRLASQGMLFTQAYAGSPVSAPSRASLMTG